VMPVSSECDRAENAWVPDCLADGDDS
jgi:hypothetical protein